MPSEIRRDYIQEKYVLIAPRRGKRPHDVEKPTRKSVDKASCPFCPENIDNAGTKLLSTKVTARKGEPWAITVIANKFPAVTTTNPKAYGYQEVVVESSDHTVEMENLSTERIVEVLGVYAKRTKELSKDKKIKYIIIFKNFGGVAGASLQHAHSQVFASQFVPPHLLDKSHRVCEYKKQHGSCIYCEVISTERTSSRFIWEDKNVIAFCPWAPMHNYEVWIMPKRHIDNITQLTKKERQSFAKILIKILTKVSDLGLPYNYYFHQVIDDKDQHLYMKVTPRGSVWAGVEIGSGLIINPIPPEEAATFYKK